MSHELTLLTIDEYTDAGIGHYWIVDLDLPVSLLAHHLAGDFGYTDCTATTGVFTTPAPLPVRVHLDQLRWPTNLGVRARGSSSTTKRSQTRKLRSLHGLTHGIGSSS